MHQRRPGSRQLNARHVNRRTAMQIGGLGAAGFGLADLLRARSQAGRHALPRETSVVWVWLQGGAPHLETFDPKMDAPSGYRSMIGALSTRLPGVEFGGLFPGLAGSANRMAVVRSFHHTNPDHLGASHYVLTANDNPGITAVMRLSFLRSTFVGILLPSASFTRVRRIWRICS